MFFGLKILSAFYDFCKYSSALHTRFYDGSKHYKPWSDYSLGSRLIWVHIVCNIAYLNKWKMKVTKVVTGDCLWLKQYVVNVLKFWTLVACQKGLDKQLRTRFEEAIWSGFSLFAILTSILWIPAQITHIFFENRKWKVCEIWQH